MSPSLSVRVPDSRNLESDLESDLDHRPATWSRHGPGRHRGGPVRSIQKELAFSTVTFLLRGLKIRVQACVSESLIIIKL
jgi:hypothetical protein